MKEYYRLKETIVSIHANDASHVKAAKKAIVFHRSLLENYIRRDPYFQITLEPHSCYEDAPEVVRRMIDASNTMDLGPMSAVAGTIASLAVEAMVEAGASFAMVDNGGDIAYITDRQIVVGIYAGESAAKDVGFVLEPVDSVAGICTSSGTVGPSISFGMADAAVVFSENVSLADSAATALSNATDTGKKAVEKAFKVLDGIKGIDGALVVQGKYIGMRGNIPDLRRASVDFDCITKG
ncbi:UPF0280 family protein [Methanohalophilus mahii]|uniref:UPF0280 protein Mmah_1253 n=1 Tax=Methanohalophilus mahii (strain ATCC 35705 / DSM 5219 / SLP) TaxID=547558 RepID=D5EC56_METMS|nr:UPF0280 family protein [Methanohalophilus mahii]ADE36757.1 ApbE family lipoprotein [Methanohalophilus mahii DSM 5219]